MKKLTDPQHCRRILKRRAAKSGVAFYFALAWKWKLFATVVAAVMIYGMWFHLDFPGKIGAGILTGFYFGVQIRDLQWWRALSKNWPQVARFLDWSKIESVAAEEEEGDESTGSDRQPEPVQSNDE